jgi:hypothetical protein
MWDINENAKPVEPNYLDAKLAEGFYGEALGRDV